MTPEAFIDTHEVYFELPEARGTLVDAASVIAGFDIEARLATVELMREYAREVLEEACKSITENTTPHDAIIALRTRFEESVIDLINKELQEGRYRPKIRLYIPEGLR